MVTAMAGIELHGMEGSNVQQQSRGHRSFKTYGVVAISMNGQKSTINPQTYLNRLTVQLRLEASLAIASQIHINLYSELFNSETHHSSLPVVTLLHTTYVLIRILVPRNVTLLSKQSR